jgi:hypothetical protein
MRHRAGDAGRIHQHVGAAEALGDRVGGGDDRRAILHRDVERDVLLPAEFADEPLRPLAPRVVPDRDARARRGEPLCRRGADAAAATGDNRDSAFQRVWPLATGTRLNHPSASN